MDRAFRAVYPARCTPSACLDHRWSGLTFGANVTREAYALAVNGRVRVDSLSLAA